MKHDPLSRGDVTRSTPKDLSAAEGLPPDAQVLGAILARVPQFGWTSRAMRAGIHDLGHHGGILGLIFPDGVTDVARMMFVAANTACAQAMRDDSPLAPRRIRDHVAEGAMAWFEALQPHRAAVKRWLAGIPVQPVQRLGVLNRALWYAADTVWSAVAPEASPNSFMSRRVLLMGVLKVTVPVWVLDTTADQTRTRAFLEHRLSNVVHAGKMVARLRTLEPREIPRRVRAFLGEWRAREGTLPWVEHA